MEPCLLVVIDVIVTFDQPFDIADAEISFFDLVAQLGHFLFHLILEKGSRSYRISHQHVTWSVTVQQLFVNDSRQRQGGVGREPRIHWQHGTQMETLAM